MDLDETGRVRAVLHLPVGGGRWRVVGHAELHGTQHDGRDCAGGDGRDRHGAAGSASGRLTQLVERTAG